MRFISACFVLRVELFLTICCYELAQLILKGNRNFNERNKYRLPLVLRKKQKAHIFIFLILLYVMWSKNVCKRQGALCPKSRNANPVGRMVLIITACQTQQKCKV